MVKKFRGTFSMWGDAEEAVQMFNQAIQRKEVGKRDYYASFELKVTVKYPDKPKPSDYTLPCIIAGNTKEAIDTIGELERQGLLEPAEAQDARKFIEYYVYKPA